MKVTTMLIMVISTIHSNPCLAEPDAKSFSFKGTRFGDSLKPEKTSNKLDLEPWEMDWGSAAKAHLYPRIRERNEKDEARLRFGEFSLRSINYKYLDGKLFEIYASFYPTTGCGSIAEIVKMLEIRYTIKLEEKYQKSTERYDGSFANQSISIDVKCDRPLLSLYEEKDAGERETSVTFRETKAYKQSQAHIMDALKKQSRDSKKLSDEKIKSEINF